jgi:hypothetical protein
MAKILGSLILLATLVGCTSVDMGQTSSVGTGQTNYAEARRIAPVEFERVAPVNLGQASSGDVGAAATGNLGPSPLNAVQINTPASRCHGIEWSWCAGYDVEYQ